MPDTDRPARRRLSPQDRREAILDVAQTLFVTRGWAAVTLSDVLDAAGLSKGGFYHHFAAKEDLLTAIVRRMADMSLAAGKLARDNTKDDALAQLNAFVEASIQWQSDNIENMRFLMDILVQPGNDELVRRIFVATQASVMPALLALIEDGVETGIFDVPDVQITAEMIYNLSQGHVAVLADAMTLMAAGQIDAAIARVDDRLRAEGAACDRLLGLSTGSVRPSRPEGLRRLLIGLLRPDAAPAIPVTPSAGLPSG